MEKEIIREKVHYNLTPEEVNALRADPKEGLIFVFMENEEPDGGMRLAYDLQNGPGFSLAKGLEKVVIDKGFPVNDVSRDLSPRR